MSLPEDTVVNHDADPELPTEYPVDRVVRLLMALGLAGLFFLCALATHILAVAGFGVAALVMAVVVLIRDFLRAPTIPSAPSGTP
jgi:hypothetical protein